MAYQRVRDLLQHLQELHEQLRRAVERAKVSQDGAPDRLLTSFLEEHEDRVRRALAKAAPAGDQLVLDTWLQFAPNEEVEKELQALDLDSARNLEDLFDRVLKAGNALVRLYEIFEAESHSPRVREFFQSLRELEDGAVKRLSVAWQQSLDG